MRILISLVFGLAAALLPLGLPSAHAQEVRVALVIANQNYRAVPQLANALQDAAAVSATLKALGFQKVQTETNLEYDSMRRVLRDFATEAEKADWAVIYYAGHGIEVDGSNYLVPVDARLSSDRDVQFEALSLSQVLTGIEGARKLRLVILDACRDNPFLRRMKVASATRSIGRGLARVEPAGGTLVAYAAKEGQVAYDGDGQNSPFVASLVQRMAEPGIEINMLFRAVRDDVLTATRQQQEPFVYGSLPNRAFYFRPPERGSSDSASPAPQLAPATSQKNVAERTAALTPSPVGRSSEPVERIVPAGRIAEVRVALASLGLDPGPADGATGPRFRKALRDFQRTYKVEESGSLDGQTLEKLDEVLARTPKTYDGLWSIEFHRYNYGAADPAGINLRTHLASAKIRVRAGEFFIVSSNMLSTDRNEFNTFQGRVDSGGNLSVSMDLTYLFGKSKTGRLAVRARLPSLVPHHQWIEVKGNRIEPEMWYKIKLQRLAS